MKEVERILNGESVREVLSHAPYDELTEMARIDAKYAKKSVTGPIPGFIYFSHCNGHHGPRVKFYGGTNETKYTENAPSYEFGIDGPHDVFLPDWMNKSNCPNAFDQKCLKEVADFISNHLALLLLTWFGLLGEFDLEQYFLGRVSFKELLEMLELEADKKSQVLQCQDEKELYQVCKDLDLYQF